MDEKTLIGRRSFIRRLGLGLAGALVAPTLAETLAIGMKKYFFIHNPTAESGALTRKDLESFMDQAWEMGGHPPNHVLLVKARQFGMTELNRKLSEALAVSNGSSLRDVSGNCHRICSVEVADDNGRLLKIYSARDSGVSLSNPFTSRPSGEWTFYVKSPQSINIREFSPGTDDKGRRERGRRR